MEASMKGGPCGPPNSATPTAVVMACCCLNEGRSLRTAEPPSGISSSTPTPKPQ